MGTGRRGARWIAAVLGIALVASAIVVYLLIKVTAPASDGDQGLSAVSSDLSQVTDVSTDGPGGATSGPPHTSAADPATGTQQTTPGGSTADEPSASPDPSSTAATATSAPASDGAGSLIPTGGAPATSTSVLPGSAVPLPAAWSGTAQVDITITGECPGTKPAHYTTPVDIAMDLAGGGATATEVASSSGTVQDGEPTLTIGVNTAATPTVAVYSAIVDNTGAFHRFWSLSTSASEARTHVSGKVVDDDVMAGENPNLLVDALKPPASCATAPVGGLPRVLAVGSTLTGWVDANSAQFTLHAVTTDGQRALTVTIAATRSQ